MISLSSPGDKTLRAQVAESVSIVAEHDFPQNWPELIDVRFEYLDISFLTLSCSNWFRPYQPLIMLCH
jgi:hypothetical protein